MAAQLRTRDLMSRRRKLLDLFKIELRFLESGGYGTSRRTPWRAPYIFEESPSCPNYSDPSRSHLCGDCWLIEFVSPDLRDEQVPCRFVQLAPDGITVDSLYRYGTQSETEETLRRWLQTRIHELEREISEAAVLPLAV